MTIRCRAALGGALLACAPLAMGQGAPPAGQTWQVDPSVYLLGSLDNSNDLPFGGSRRDRGEPLAAANAGLGLDLSRPTQDGWLKGSFFGLARSPFSDFDRTLFGAGWVEASKRLGQTGRLTFTDEGKVQTRPSADVSDYWYNVAALRAEWKRPSGGGWELEADDRRRGLPDLPFLGFSQDSLGVGILLPRGSKARARLGVEVQRYSAITAEGGRGVFEGELAAFTRRGVALLRLAWFQPFGDRRRPVPPGTGTDEGYEFGDVGRSEFFETLTFRNAHTPLLEGSSLFDPLESESDQWDFGRRKLTLVAFASRKIGTRTEASVFLRLQHKRGPDLLLPADVADAGSFTDDRLESRAVVDYRLRRRTSLLLQGWYVESWSGRQPLDFRRFMASAGVQFHF